MCSRASYAAGSTTKATSFDLSRGFGYELSGPTSLLPLRRATTRARGSLSTTTQCFRNPAPTMSRDEYLNFLESHQAQVKLKSPKSKPKRHPRPSSAPNFRKPRSKHFGIDCSNQQSTNNKANQLSSSNIRRGNGVTRRRSVADAGTWCCPASKVSVRQLQRQRQRLAKQN